jgi:hypothetical protein
MTLPFSTSLVNELQHWFSKAVIYRNLNKDKIPYPVQIPTVYLKPKSFIQLLFDESYPFTEYDYFFQDIEAKSKWPSVVRERITIYASAKMYEICDSTNALNLFFLQADDLTLLNALLAYRIDPTRLTLVDSTSVILVDSTATITLYASLDALSTNLSKLIWVYLKLKIDEDTSVYDTTTLISQPFEVLQSCYEAFVIELYFDFVAAREVIPIPPCEEIVT